MAVAMVSLDAARIEDLGLGDAVIIECAACDHVAMLTAAHLARLGARPESRVLDLGSRVRCQSCDALGRAAVSIKWGAPWVNGVPASRSTRRWPAKQGSANGAVDAVA